MNDLNVLQKSSNGSEPFEARGEQLPANMLNGGPGLADLSIKPRVKRHKDNKISLQAIFWLGALVVFGLVIYSSAKAAMAPSPKPTPIDLRDVVQIAPTAIPGVPVDRPAAPVVYVTVIAPVQSALPTYTPYPSPIPVVNPTALPDVLLSIKTYWPKRLVNNAKTAAGVSLLRVDGFGAACPGNMPLGTLLHVAGRTLTCVDRANLRCSGGVCSVVLYASKAALDGIYPAYVKLPDRNWSSP